jgi:exopolyphosphatase/guanosine-5'-triphosphate,3'-diphosphate pyrophosphatase
MDRARGKTDMRTCAIDIGTNTFLLLIADITANGVLTPVVQEQRVPRIGRSVDANGVLGVAAFDRSVWILNEFRNIAKHYRCDALTACATSAVRDAANRTEYLGYLRRETGLTVEILSGEQEALLTYRGAVSDAGAEAANHAVIDIGGGSTELIYPSQPGQQNSLRSASTQAGCVRITERFFPTDPPANDDVVSAQNFIRGSFQEIGPVPDTGYRLLGVAGTVTTLAALDQGLTEYRGDLVSGYKMHREVVGSWRRRLCGMSSAEIRSLSGVTEGREDIIAAGALILETVMELCGFDEVTATERGLRYGIALREFDRRQK